jgi:uncharacterized protein involved in response to NO
MGTAQQIRAHRGPPLLSLGLRPFFLLGALWSALAVALWVPMLIGALVLPIAWNPVAWHVHEMIYGFVPAIVAGFLLTAVPNWTGRLPVTGAPLLALVLVWLAGRLVVLTSAVWGPTFTAAVDLAFLVLLATVIGREIFAGKNWPNAKVLAVVVALALGNLVFHVAAAEGSAAELGSRIGVGAAILLIAIIGGRIIPSFTRNWLARRQGGRLPAPFDRFDVAALAVTGVALVSWVVMPTSESTGLAAIAAALVNFGRIARWAGERTTSEPLVLVLHVGFAFVPIGFLLLALSIFAPASLPASGALHAWTAGAIGLMTLAVMTRASLGHTGRALAAGRAVQALYLAAFASVIARLLAAAGVAAELLLALSAVAWVTAFGGFVMLYGPWLLAPRADEAR